MDVDNRRNGFFIDSVLNHEVVKLFTNEKQETARYDAAGNLKLLQDIYHYLFHHLKLTHPLVISSHYNNNDDIL